MWVEQLRVPEGDKTHCLKLDSILKSELPMEALEMDRKLPHLQNFMLDTAGPLLSVIEKLTMLEKPDPDVLLSVIQQAFIFQKNKSSHFSHERRTKVPI